MEVVEEGVGVTFARAWDRSWLGNKPGFWLYIGCKLELWLFLGTWVEKSSSFYGFKDWFNVKRADPSVADCLHKGCTVGVLKDLLVATWEGSIDVKQPNAKVDEGVKRELKFPMFGIQSNTRVFITSPWRRVLTACAWSQDHIN